MKGYKPIDTVNLQVVEPVDCGTCPVSMACAVEQGGNGYTYECCHATGFVAQTEDGGAELLMIDCARHKFESNSEVADLPSCPLCSGDAVTIELLGLGTQARWLPTVHASVPARTRLAKFRETLPVAQKLYGEIEKRKKAL